MASILEIEGIGPVNAAKLRDAGARSTTALLNQAGSAKAARNWRVQLALMNR